MLFINSVSRLCFPLAILATLGGCRSLHDPADDASRGKPTSVELSLSDQVQEVSPSAQQESIQLVRHQEDIAAVTATNDGAHFEELTLGPSDLSGPATPRRWEIGVDIVSYSRRNELIIKEREEEIGRLATDGDAGMSLSVALIPEQSLRGTRGWEVSLDGIWGEGETALGGFPEILAYTEAEYTNLEINRFSLTNRASDAYRWMLGLRMINASDRIEFRNPFISGSYVSGTEAENVLLGGHIGFEQRKFFEKWFVGYEGIFGGYGNSITEQNRMRLTPESFDSTEFAYSLEGSVRAGYQFTQYCGANFFFSTLTMGNVAVAARSIEDAVTEDRIGYLGLGGSLDLQF